MSDWTETHKETLEARAAEVQTVFGAANPEAVAIRAALAEIERLEAKLTALEADFADCDRFQHTLQAELDAIRSKWVQQKAPQSD